MKKLISILLLISSLTLCLASCGHEHSYGEWTVDEYPTYSQNGSKSRTCSDCGEEETKTIEAYGNEGVYEYLNGYWKEKDTDGMWYIYFEDSRFTATFEGLSFLGAEGTVEISEDKIVLKEDDGQTYIYFTYSIANDTIALIDYEFNLWEKFEKTAE